MRYLLLIVLSATLLAACGGSPAPTGSSAPTSPAAPTQPVAPTQPPEATAAPEATAVPEATAAPATAAPTKGDTQAPNANAEGVLVIFKRTGGIAGVNDVLTVYEDGRVTYVGRNAENTAQVAPEELAELRRLLATPEFAALDRRYSALGADLFSYSITTARDGKAQTVITMDGANNPQILNQVLAEVGKLLQAHAK
jgi:hypothetical protein